MSANKNSDAGEGLGCAAMIFAVLLGLGVMSMLRDIGEAHRLTALRASAPNACNGATP